MVKIPMFNGKYIFIHGGFSSQSFVGFSGGKPGTLGLFDENPWLEMCHGQGCRVFLGINVTSHL